jgi:hypothetical protein
MAGVGLIQQQSDVSDFLVQRLVAIDRVASKRGHDPALRGERFLSVCRGHFWETVRGRAPWFPFTGCVCGRNTGASPAIPTTTSSSRRRRNGRDEQHKQDERLAALGIFRPCRCITISSSIVASHRALEKARPCNHVRRLEKLSSLSRTAASSRLMNATSLMNWNFLQHGKKDFSLP